MTISTEMAGSRRPARRSRYMEIALMLSLALNSLMLVGFLVAPPCHTAQGDETSFGRDGLGLDLRTIPERGLVFNDDLD